MENKELLFALCKQYLGCLIEYADRNGKIIKARLTGISMDNNLDYYPSIETTFLSRKGKAHGCTGDLLVFKPTKALGLSAFNIKLLLRTIEQLTDQEIKNPCFLIHNSEIEKVVSREKEGFFISYKDFETMDVYHSFFSFDEIKVCKDYLHLIGILTSTLYISEEGIPVIISFSELLKSENIKLIK